MNSTKLVAVDASPGQSRYGALAAALKARILAGEWPPGSAMPAEQTLAAEHGVALGTLRQALALLVEQGLVDRLHGKGTFVRSGLSGAPMLRFFRFGDGSGQVPASRIASRKVLPAPAGVARHRVGQGSRPSKRTRPTVMLSCPPCSFAHAASDSASDVGVVAPCCAASSSSERRCVASAA